jgi:hypothetical protein
VTDGRLVHGGKDVAIREAAPFLTSEESVKLELSEIALDRIEGGPEVFGEAALGREAAAIALIVKQEGRQAERVA